MSEANARFLGNIHARNLVDEMGASVPVSELVGMPAKYQGALSTYRHIDDLPDEATTGLQVMVASTVFEFDGERWVPHGVIDARAYGVVGDGVTDDTAAIQRAIDEAPDGATIKVFGTALVSTVNLVPGKSVDVWFEMGVQTVNKPVVHYAGPLTERPVTSVSTVEHDLTGSSEGTTRTTKLVVDGAGLRRGDVVKIRSDDLMFPDSTVNRDLRKLNAEFAVVSAVVSDGVILSAPVREHYTSNVRVCLFDTAQISVSGNFKSSQAALDSDVNVMLVHIMHALSPVLDLATSDAADSLVRVENCHSAQVTVDAQNCRNEPGNVRYGYGVDNSSSGYCRVIIKRAVNVRHAYTTNGDEWGRAEHNVISGQAHGCSNAAFDTHKETFGDVFENAHSHASFRGATAAGTAFQLRGKGCKIIGCTGSGVVGVSLFEQADDAEMIGSHFVGWSYGLDSNGTALPEGALKLRTRDCTFKTVGGRDASRIRNTVWDTDGCEVANTSSVEFPRLVEQQGSFITAGPGSVWSLGGATGNSGRVVDMSSGTSADVFRSNGGRFVLGPHTKLISGNGNVSARSRIIAADVSASGEVEYSTGFPTNMIEVSFVLPSGRRSGVYTQNLTANAELAYLSPNDGSPRMVMSVSLDADLRNGYLNRPGSYAGQSLRVVNTSGVNQLVVSGNVQRKTKTLQPGESYEFVWDGSRWS